MSPLHQTHCDYSNCNQCRGSNSEFQFILQLVGLACICLISYNEKTNIINTCTCIHIHVCSHFKFGLTGFRATVFEYTFVYPGQLRIWVAFVCHCPYPHSSIQPYPIHPPSPCIHVHVHVISHSNLFPLHSCSSMYWCVTLLLLLFFVFLCLHVQYVVCTLIYMYGRINNNNNNRSKILTVI